MTRTDLIIHPDRDALAAEVADRTLALLRSLTEERERVDIALTGGSVGIAVLAALATTSGVEELPWDRIHLWWGDERYVDADSDDRNAKQAREALIDFVPVPVANVHELPASDEITDLDEASAAATAELGDVTMALTFLGMGPDAHIASLFPGHEATLASERGVIAVRNSPKPPSERLSLTLPTLNASERVWLVVAGEDKASALALALTKSPANEVPAAAVHGTIETLYLVDRDATAGLSDRLLES